MGKCERVTFQILTPKNLEYFVLSVIIDCCSCTSDNPTGSGGYYRDCLCRGRVLCSAAADRGPVSVYLQTACEQTRVLSHVRGQDLRATHHAEV